MRAIRRAGMRLRVFGPGLLLVLGLVLGLGLHGGCPGEPAERPGSELPDLAAPPEPACVAVPRTHVEILNACTDAQFVNKRVVLPLLRPDGTLPPLP